MEDLNKKPFYAALKGRTKLPWPKPNMETTFFFLYGYIYLFFSFFLCQMDQVFLSYLCISCYKSPNLLLGRHTKLLLGLRSKPPLL